MAAPRLRIPPRYIYIITFSLQLAGHQLGPAVQPEDQLAGRCEPDEHHWYAAHLDEVLALLGLAP